MPTLIYPENKLRKNREKLRRVLVVPSVPVKYAGVGEGIDDLKPFDAMDFAQALI